MIQRSLDAGVFLSADSIYWVGRTHSRTSSPVTGQVFENFQIMSILITCIAHTVQHTLYTRRTSDQKTCSPSFSIQNALLFNKFISGSFCPVTWTSNWLKLITQIFRKIAAICLILASSNPLRHLHSGTLYWLINLNVFISTPWQLRPAMRALQYARTVSGSCFFSGCSQRFAEHSHESCLRSSTMKVRSLNLSMDKDPLLMMSQRVPLFKRLALAEKGMKNCRPLLLSNCAGSAL